MKHSESILAKIPLPMENFSSLVGFSRGDYQDTLYQDIQIMSS